MVAVSSLATFGKATRLALGPRTHDAAAFRLPVLRSGKRFRARRPARASRRSLVQSHPSRIASSPDPGDPASLEGLLALHVALPTSR